MDGKQRLAATDRQGLGGLLLVWDLCACFCVGNEFLVQIGSRKCRPRDSSSFLSESPES